MDATLSVKRLINLKIFKILIKILNCVLKSAI